MGENVLGIKTQNNQNRFLEIIVNLLLKTVIPLVLILTLNNIALSFQLPIILYVDIPLSLYMIKQLLDIKHVAENVHLFLPNPNNCKPEPYTQYDIHLESGTLTDGELKLLHEWSRGISVKQLDVHPMILNRLLRKYIRLTLAPKPITISRDTERGITRKS
jgi:hypothetical protein